MLDVQTMLDQVVRSVRATNVSVQSSTGVMYQGYVDRLEWCHHERKWLHAQSRGELCESFGEALASALEAAIQDTAIMPMDAATL